MLSAAGACSFIFYDDWKPYFSISRLNSSWWGIAWHHSRNFSGLRENKAIYIHLFASSGCHETPFMQGKRLITFCGIRSIIHYTSCSAVVSIYSRSVNKGLRKILIPKCHYSYLYHFIYCIRIQMSIDICASKECGGGDVCDKNAWLDWIGHILFLSLSAFETCCSSAYEWRSATSPLPGK